MDGRGKDFDNILILFMKMEMGSCSKLNSNDKKNYFLAVLFMYLLTSTKIAGQVSFSISGIAWPPSLPVTGICHMSAKFCIF